MAFGFAGAASGAAKSLEDIVAERLLTQKLEAEIANRQKLTELEQAQLNQRAVEHSDNVKARQRDDDRMDAERRRRDGVQGVRRMIGESLMQGGEPDRKALAAMQIEAGDAPTMLNEPKKERDPIADFEAQEKIRAKYRVKPVGNTAPPDQVFVKRGDQVVPIVKGTAQPGDLPYDPVAARSSQPSNPAEAEDTAREATRIASELLKHPGFGGAFGVVDSMLPTIRQSTADAEALRDSLTSLLTLENMGKMKGVLSDSDMKVLRQASTTLSGKMSNGAARSELTRLVQTLGKVGGGQVTPDAGAANDPEAAALALIQRARAGRKPGG